MDIRWRLRNIKTGDIVDISKSIFKVGRDSKADIKSTLVGLSRQQATFSILVDGELYIVDCKSLNGTYVNAIKISSTEPTLLKHKDIIGFGICQKEIEKRRVSEDNLALLYEVIDERASKVLNTAPALGKEKATVDGGQKEKEKSTLSNSNLTDKSFSQEDDLIIISDDEDSAFASSQLYELSAMVKKEQASLSEVYDPYSEIKEELKALDAFEAENVVSVDLTDEIDHFESTEALVDLLETPRRDPNTTLDVLGILDTPSSKEKNKKIIETSSILENVEMDMEFCNTSDKEKRINIIQEKTLPKTLTIVVEPHSEANISTKKSSKEPFRRSKRKSTSSLEVPKSKKLKISGSSKRCSLPDRSNVDCHLDKSDINNRSKRKSKDSAKKNLTANDSVSKCTRSSSNAKESKIDFKSRKANIPSSLIQADNLKNKIVSNSNIVESNKFSDKIPKQSNTREITGMNSELKTPALPIKNDPRTKRRQTRSRQAEGPIMNIENKLCKAMTKPNTVDQIQDDTVSSNSSPLYNQNYNSEMSVQNNRHGVFKSLINSNADLVWQSHFHRNTNIIFNHYRHLDNVDEYIHTIVNWSFRWVKEQWISDIISPPVSNKPPVMVPNTFDSIQRYADVFEPLVLLELWQLIFQTLGEDRKHMQVHITHERRHGDLLYLDCECHYSVKDFMSNTIIRSEDFTLFEVKCKDAKHTYQFTGFAFIKHSNRINNIHSEGSKSPNFKFTLITRYLAMQISGDQLLVKTITNIGKILKLLKSIKYLEQSPLCRHVMNPDSTLFQLPTVSQQLEIKQNKLNARQKEIVLEARHVCLSEKPKIYLINGPPGTGKSTVIINIVLEIIFSSIRMGKSPLILLTAPSNAAVDGLILKLADTRRKFPDNQRAHLKIVRIGPDSSISEKVNKFKSTHLAQNHLIKEYNIAEMPEYREYYEKGAIDQLLRKKLGNKYNYELRRVEDLVLFKSNVVCTTLNSCVNYKIVQASRKGDLPPFTCCIVDEATQCNELESLLPIQLGVERFVLVGDPMQLPAVVCNKQAQQLGYGKSLFSRISVNFKNQSANPIKMLNEQFRMAPEICEYPNKTFYHGELISLPSWRNKLEPPLKPYLLFNLTSSQNNDSSDYVNTNEAHMICKILECLKQRIKTQNYSIGIITPYKAQTDLLKTKTSSIKFNQGVEITVNTVDSFQGMENDIIIISSVRASNNNFLQNEQRLNVALTRARQALYVVGNYSLFKECKPLYDLRENAKKRKLCLDIKDNPKNIHAFHKLIFK